MCARSFRRATKRLKLCFASIFFDYFASSRCLMIWTPFSVWFHTVFLLFVRLLSFCNEKRMKRFMIWLCCKQRCFSLCLFSTFRMWNVNSFWNFGIYAPSTVSIVYVNFANKNTNYPISHFVRLFWFPIEHWVKYRLCWNHKMLFVLPKILHFLFKTK